MSLIGGGYARIGVSTCGVHISRALASLYRRLPSPPGRAPCPSWTCSQRARSFALDDRPPAGAATWPRPSRSVEDNGPGIDPDDAKRVFEAFYRSPRASAEGSWLGLAIVREIARAHGAWWSLASRPDFPGTRITVVFPGPRIGAKLSRQE